MPRTASCNFLEELKGGRFTLPARERVHKITALNLMSLDRALCRNLTGYDPVEAFEDEFPTGGRGLELTGEHELLVGVFAQITAVADHRFTVTYPGRDGRRVHLEEITEKDQRLADRTG